MLELLIGVKGTGKTKKLIDMVGAALETSKGNVVCVEKGSKLTYDINYRARLVDTEQYGVTGADALYGLAAGLVAADHDLTDLFIDNTMKICGSEEAFFELVDRLSALSEKIGFHCVISASMPKEDLPQKYSSVI